MMKIISTSNAIRKGLFDTFRKNFNLTQKIVTNPDVKFNFINLIRSYLGDVYAKVIGRLVKRNRIIPVQCTADLIKQLNSNLKGDACINPKEYENVLGFYTGNQNRLYILIDNINRLIGSNAKQICEVTVHELQHMCCYNFTGQFIGLWSKELYTFYAYFMALLYKSHTSGLRTMWNSISGKDKQVISNLLDPDNGVKYLVQYLIYNFEYLYCCMGSHISTTDIKIVAEKYCNTLQNNGCDKSITDRISDDICDMVYDMLTGNIQKSYSKNGHKIIVECFRQAYLKVFNKDPWKDGTMIYQELIFPSEVICISSQYKIKNSKYYKFLNSL